MFNIGFTEMLLIAVFALVFLGPKQLPQVARAIGRMIGEFKRATDGISRSFLDFNEEAQKSVRDMHEDFKISDALIGENLNEPSPPSQPHQDAQTQLNLEPAPKASPVLEKALKDIDSEGPEQLAFSMEDLGDLYPRSLYKDREEEYRPLPIPRPNPFKNPEPRA